MRQIQAIFQAMGHDLEIVSHLSHAYTVDFDRLLLLGGVDVDPGYYNQVNMYSQRSHSERDRIEWALVRRAILAGIPIMGICRGCQMLAVAAGGDLYQDIGIQAGKKLHNGYSHSITVKKPLADKIPSLRVNSYHHQAVKTVPKRFKVVARAYDGTIEAIWRPGALGVQFHPELMFDDEYRWIYLFRWLIDGLSK
jgi:putative glutamine amidotransferase